MFAFPLLATTSHHCAYHLAQERISIVIIIVNNYF